MRKIIAAIFGLLLAGAVQATPSITFTQPATGFAAGYIQANATGTISLPNDSSFNRITFDVTAQNVGAIGTITASPWSITIARSGWYVVEVIPVYHVTAISPHVGTYVNVNGSNIGLSFTVFSVNEFYQFTNVGFFFFNVGDVVYATANHSGGGTVDASTGGQFTITLLK